MATSTIKASTEDNTNGTPVCIVTNEDNGGTALQGMVPLGNKQTWSETGRTGLTSNDTATTDLTTAGFGSSGLVDLGNALSVEVRAACDTASRSLVGRLVFYDASSNPLSTSESLSFSSDAALKTSGTRYVCQRQLVDAGQGRKCKFYVDSITGTTWDVFVRPI